MNAIKSFFTLILYQPLLNALLFLAWLIPGHSVGWAIIALTILIRLILLPSTVATLKHQQKLRNIQPKLDALKAKHGDDKDAHSKATMELYAAEQVNPFGGCLSTLVQTVVLVVLYRVFIHGLSVSQFSLLYPFTPHMSTVNTMWFGLNLTKPEQWVMPFLVAGLQYFQARQMMAITTPPTTTPGTQADVSATMQKQMVYFLPIMMFLISRSVPAALSLYYVVFSLFSVIQQGWYLRGPVPATAPVVLDSSTKELPAKTEPTPVKTKVTNDVIVSVRTKGSAKGKE